MRRFVPATLVLGLIAAVTGGAVLLLDPGSPETGQWPAEADERGYVGSDSCGGCHPLNHEGWKQTLHATMVQAATASTVIGDFEVRNEYRLSDGLPAAGTPRSGEDPVLVRMRREGGAYVAEILDPETGRMNPYRITHVVGTAFRQTYLVESRGTWFRVPVEWAAQQRRWVNFWNRQDRRPETVGAPMEHFLNVNGHWNEYCARCHTTGYRQEGSGRWKELGIACESCHGPGAAHVAYFRDTKRFRLRATLMHWAGRTPETWIVKPTRLDAASGVSVCGQCHMADIWLDSVPAVIAYEPGGNLSPHFDEVPLEPSLATPASNRTWPDASPRGPGVLFRSFVDSRCFREGGAACTDCHAPHARGEFRELLVPGDASDAYCRGCHKTIGPDAASVEAHTHHAARTPGSRCYDCHMPRLLEGLVMTGDYDYGKTRTHALDHIPYPEATIRYGGGDAAAMPNACADCHADRPAEWAAEQATRWWGPRAQAGAAIEARLAAAASAIRSAAEASGEEKMR